MKKLHYYLLLGLIILISNCGKEIDLNDRDISESLKLKNVEAFKSVDNFEGALRFEERFYQFRFAADSPTGTEVGTVSASGADNINYSLFKYKRGKDKGKGIVNDENPFAVDASTGIITTAQPYDEIVAEQSKYGFIVAAASGAEKAWAKVLIIDENALIFDQRFYQFRLAADSPTGTEVGTVSASGADNISYSLFKYKRGKDKGKGIVNDENPFAVGANTGIITTTQPYDEIVAEQPKYGFAVVANSGEDKAWAKVLIVDEDVLLFDKHLYHFRIPEGRPAGTVLGAVSVSGVDNVSYSFSEESDQFAIDVHTGSINIKQSAEDILAEQSKYRLSVVATTSDSRRGVARLFITDKNASPGCKGKGKHYGKDKDKHWGKGKR